MMKYFTNVKNIEDLRKMYRDLLKKFHPDNIGGSEEATKEINTEYEIMFEKLKNIHAAAGAADATENEKYNKDIDAALWAAIKKIINLEGLDIEIRGVWVWVSGATYKWRTELKNAGFKWCPDKREWQYHTEPFKKHKGSKKMSDDDIRNRYGCQSIKSTVAPKLAC